MLEVSEAASDATTELDEPVDGLGAAVAGTVGVEVRQERCPPPAQRLSQPRDLRDRAGRQRVDELLGQTPTLGRGGLVEHVTDVLGAHVGDLDRDVIGVGCERCFQAGLLAGGEAFLPGPEDVTDAVERVARTASVAEGLLLDPTARVIDGAGGELDDVERIQHAGGVLELVIDRVLVALERVECGDLDLLAEPFAAFVEPVPVGVAGSAGDEVEQPGGGVGSVSQVHHPGGLLRTAPSWVAVVPDMLVHAQDLHALEAGWVVRGRDQDWSDLGPEGVPGRAELAGQALDRRSLTAELSDCPADRARAQQPSRSADVGVLLDEGGDVAEGLAADPAAFAPPDPHRPACPGRVDHRGHDPAMPCGDDSTAGASGDGIAGLHLEYQARGVFQYCGQMEVGEVEEEIASAAAVERVGAGARRVGHRRGPWCEQRLESAHHRGPRRLPPSTRARSACPHSTLKSLFWLAFSTDPQSLLRRLSIHNFARRCPSSSILQWTVNHENS